MTFLEKPNWSISENYRGQTAEGLVLDKAS